MKKCLIVLLALAILLSAFSAFAETEEKEGYTLWGVTVSPEDTAVTFEGAGKADISELYGLLDAMPQLEEVNFYDREIYLRDVKPLIEKYPDVHFGLTIKLNKSHIIRTDMTAYSTLGRQPQITQANTFYFSYLKDLKALDIGHMTVHSLEFLRECAPLKILIVADCSIRDLTPLESQTELEYLEIFKNYITDITPLAKLTNLRDLNLGYNQITDLSPLYDLPNLERLVTMGNWYLPKEEIERFKEHQPDVEVFDYCYGATGNKMYGDMIQIPGTSWRHHRHYDTIYWIFHNNQYIDWDVEVPQVKTENDP